MAPSDCPNPMNECVARTCNAGVCGTTNVASGAHLAAQTPGDCRVAACNGAGSSSTIDDDTDTPNDGLVCTTDTCVAGTPTFTNANAGTNCGTGLVCNATGQCVGCLAAADCAGVDDECQSRTCIGGICGTSFTPSGTPVSGQVVGDCKKKQCNGLGVIETVDDNGDPLVDTNQCTDDLCTAGVPSNGNSFGGKPCTQSGGTKCDGLGACVACIVNADCGVDTECATHTCSGGSCQVANAANGTPTATQAVGDCKQIQCDGNGGVKAVALGTDLPVDGKVCTDDVCTGPTPSNPYRPLGTACGGAQQCDGAGACVACFQASDCGTDTDCKTWSCTASHTCQENDVAVGTPTSTQTLGDCLENQCDGIGNSVSAAVIDLPVDGNQCTQDVCTAGVASNPFQPLGTACSQLGGSFCNASGSCVQCNAGSQCASLVCSSGACQTPSCSDSVMNGTESDTDCGGSCTGCANTAHCNAGSDCLSGNCAGGFCAGPGVSSVLPANLATGVLESSTVTITFNGAMLPSTLTTKTTLDSVTCTESIQVSTDDFATCIPVTLALSAGNTVATLTPAPALSFGSTYKVKVSTAAQSATSVPLSGDFVSSFTTRNVPQASSGIVISQVYGNGGNTGATWLNDFIELHNRGMMAVSVAGWAVQYAGATGSSWSTTALTGSIAPGAYYLVQGGGGTNGSVLPTADVTGTINMSGATGKVALTNTVTPLTTACPTGGAIVDFIGFGSMANCAEGTKGPAQSATTADLRKNNGCTDAGDNAADFTATTVVTPGPRNGSNTVYVCRSIRNETDDPQEAGFCNVQFPTSVSVQTGTAMPTLYGRIFKLGVTETAGASASVIAELGYGPRSTNPETESGWTFQSATYNVQVGNDDEYKFNGNAPAVADYSYAFRFSLDGGQSFTYCDDDGAGSNALLSFETPQLPLLHVTP